MAVGSSQGTQQADLGPKHAYVIDFELLIESIFYTFVSTDSTLQWHS